MGIEIEVSLDEIVALIKVPPLIRKIFNGELILVPSEREKFGLLKKSYDDSFKKIISSRGSISYFEFRHFLKKYDYFFGEDIFNFLDNLGNKSIDYVLGSLQFEENIKKHKCFISKNIPKYTH
ncbi:MAG: hypothetical protein ABIH28_02420 [archaeon]